MDLWDALEANAETQLESFLEGKYLVALAGDRVSIPVNFVGEDDSTNHNS